MGMCCSSLVWLAVVGIIVCGAFLRRAAVCWGAWRWRVGCWWFQEVRGRLGLCSARVSTRRTSFVVCVCCMCRWRALGEAWCVVVGG